MAKINFKEAIFDNVAEEAAAIRKQIEGALFYGVPIDEYPSRADVELVIAYNLVFIKGAANRIEIPEAKPEEQKYPSYMDAGGEY